MKKIGRFFITTVIFAVLSSFISCGSTDSEDTVISTVEANHIKVDVTNTNVKITLTKSENENISQIEVYEIPSGSVTSVQMTELETSFIWPFAEAGKEYKLCAKIYGDSISEEYVSFTTGDNIKNIITYSDDFKNALISLVAKGNTRILQLNASYDIFNSLTKKVKAQNVSFELGIYSGKHYKANATDYALVGKSITDFGSKETVQKFINGIDILEESYRFNLTTEQLNSKLSQNKTYFAVATISFQVSDYPSNITFKTDGVYSNDTIYTPVPSSELPKVLTENNAK